MFIFLCWSVQFVSVSSCSLHRLDTFYDTFLCRSMKQFFVFFGSLILFMILSYADESNNFSSTSQFASGTFYDIFLPNNFFNQTILRLPRSLHRPDTFYFYLSYFFHNTFLYRQIKQFSFPPAVCIGTILYMPINLYWIITKNNKL